MAPIIGEIQYHMSGDIGGIGVSRFRFLGSSTTPSTADVAAAAAAVKGLFSAMASYLPQQIQWTCASTANVFDAATGLVQGPLVVSPLPTVVSGSLSGNYPAGVGARLTWKTGTIHGRRLIRGTWYLVPLASGGFQSTGAVGGGVVTGMANAASAYLSAMNTANLTPVVWHRPPPKTESGGVVAAITAYTVSSTPAGLRSRRS
jgi:hypothetical protein